MDLQLLITGESDFAHFALLDGRLHVPRVIFPRMLVNVVELPGAVAIRTHLAGEGAMAVKLMSNEIMHVAQLQ